MEEFNFASERVQELISRLQGVTFFCVVAMAVTAGSANPDFNPNRPADPADPDFNPNPANPAHPDFNPDGST